MRDPQVLSAAFEGCGISLETACGQADNATTDYSAVLDGITPLAVIPEHRFAVFTKRWYCSLTFIRGER
jgi:hypothetical protein